MKKILGFMLGFIFATVFAMSAVAGVCDSHSGSNENAQNYSVWASTVKSYLHSCDDGKLMKVQYLANENKILVEYYSSDYSLVSSTTVTPQLPVFGGFYAVGSNYFVLTGQNNPSESSSVACFAVTKYDKNWKVIATALLKDCNTTVPFDAGSARFCHSGNYLIIRTSHEMYADEKGVNHQANVTMQLDMTTMKITDSFTDVASNNYGYVSHSFNQFVKIDSGKIVAVDHGDAIPRSIVLTKYQTDMTSGKFVPAYYKPCTTVDMFEIAGEIGVNQTGCSVGGFEITSSGYLTAINSIGQGSNSSVRNIYLCYAAKNSGSATVKQITYYSSAGASTPHLVKINENRFLILWLYDGRVHYCETDGEGNIKGQIISFDGALSDCQPIIYSGKLVWYVWNNNKTDFYGINLSDISKNSVSTYETGHNYSVVSAGGTTVNLRCSKCGSAAKGNVPSKFYLYWEDLASSVGNFVSFSSNVASSYHPQEAIRLMVKFTSADFNDYEIVSSDSSVALIVCEAGQYAVKTLGEGTAKVTIRSKYNTAIETEYSVKVSHNWKDTENIEATCEKEGSVAKKCTVCNENTVETVPAKGHSMSAYTVIKEATCKAAGTKKSTCSLCGYGDTAEIPKKDHDGKVIVDAVAATCTKQGKTAGKKCSGCGTVTVAQETVAALGHNLGSYKITKAPTCTAQGEETATCSRCSYTKTQSVARTPHTEVTVKAVAPTCTKQGKTAGSKCSVCDRIITEQESVDALGHDLGAYEITKKPTCTAQGEETAKCIRCSYTKTQSVARTPHTEVTVKAVAPTCTKQGKTAGSKCSVCDRIIIEQESVDVLGHDLGKYEITKKPTCTAQGEETAKCTRCSYTKTQSVARIPHTEVTVKAVSPTCTKQGKTAGSKCSVCDRIIIEQESVDALGHDLGAYEITKKPTCTAQGEETATCTRCSYTKTQDIPKTPHTEVTVKAVAPTCTKSGKTAGKKCSVCDKVITAQQTVDALGHSKKQTVIATATKEANGKVSTVCKTCGHDFGENRVYKIKSITLSSVECTYSGKTKTPTVTVTDANSDKLIKDRDYTVTYSSGRKDIGKYSVKVKFKDKYSGSETLYFEILPGKTSKITATQSTSVVSLKWDAVSGANGYRVYQYSSKTSDYKLIASVKNTTKYRVTKLKAGTDYKFAVKAYFKDENGKVYFSESKTAIATATEPAVPTMTLKAGSKSATVSWTKCTGVTGYQVYYCTAKNGTYKKLKSTAALSYKKTGLTVGKTYYFKVRAYKKTSSGTVYGQFGKVQSVKIK